MKKSELRQIIKEELQKLNEVDDVIQQIGNIANVKDMMSMRKDLEKIFNKKSIDFALSPIAHWRIKHNGKTIIIVNKKYADDADLTVGPYAIGYEGKI